MNEVQKIKMYPTSGEIWPISPPSKQKVDELSGAGGEKGDIIFTVSTTFVLKSRFAENERTVVTETKLSETEKKAFNSVLTKTNSSFTIHGLIPRFYR